VPENPLPATQTVSKNTKNSSEQSLLFLFSAHEKTG
jgi:hypothetical protein